MKVVVKTNKIFWGILFILAAVLLLLNAFGVTLPFTSVFGRFSAFQIVMGILLVIWMISSLLELKIKDIFFPLAFLFMVFEKNIAHALGLENENIVSNWWLVLGAILLSIGFSILFPPRRHHVSKSNSHTAFSCGTAKKAAQHETNIMGSSIVYIDCGDFSAKSFKNVMGEFVIRFENEHLYTGGKEIHLENTMGEMVLEVPASWKIRCDMQNTFGEIIYPKKQKTDGPELLITGENKFGETVIRSIED